MSGRFMTAYQKASQIIQALYPLLEIKPFDKDQDVFSFDDLIIKRSNQIYVNRWSHEDEKIFNTLLTSYPLLVERYKNFVAIHQAPKQLHFEKFESLELVVSKR
jgi:hypothetical protein